MNLDFTIGKHYSEVNTGDRLLLQFSTIYVCLNNKICNTIIGENEENGETVVFRYGDNQSVLVEEMPVAW